MPRRMLHTVLLAALCLAGQARGGADPKRPALSALSLSEQTIDWGRVSNSTPLERTITARNMTGRRVHFTVKAGCGCTAVAVDQTDLQPGMDARITITFSPAGRSGPQSKTVALIVDEPAGYAAQVITIRADINTSVTFEPARMHAREVDHRSGVVQRLVITAQEPSFTITGIESSSPYVQARPLEAVVIGAGAGQVIQVTVEIAIGKGAPIGRLEASVTFTSSDQQIPVRTYLVSAEVFGDARVHPAQIISSPRTPSTNFKGEVSIDSTSGAELAITSIDVEGRPDMHLIPDARRADTGKGYTLTISGNTPAEQGLFTAYLIVTTRGAADETLRIPINAAVTQPLIP